MNHIIIRTLLLILLLSAALPGVALDLSHYKTESALSSGKWVKISVDQSGVYRIPAATLRNWGFSDAGKVRIYGYGGARIPDCLSAENYIDDLPLVKALQTADGSLVFYGVGPESWTSTSISYRRFNPYSTVGYYFLSDTAEDLPQIESTATPSAANPATTFTERIQHELELVSPGECGQLLVGENFKYTNSRKYHFDLPDNTGDVKLQTSFIAKTLGTTSKLEFVANGKSVASNQSNIIAASSASGEVHGLEGVSVNTLSGIGESLDLTLTHKSSGVVYNAWLNYIAINYERKLSMPQKGLLSFRSPSKALSLDKASDGLTIWDVTDPQSVKAVNYAIEGNTAKWTAAYENREYVAWSSLSALPVPTRCEDVANQNLHADNDYDMVIFTPALWENQAERLAELHRGAPDNFNVKVVDVEKVYNEFSSGTADVSGLRKYIKMLYDRSQSGEHKLKFVLLMGRATYDERHLTDGVKGLGSPTLPSWQQRDDRGSLNSEDGFATDDFLAMLDDNSGTRMGLDQLTVAVGRMPVTSQRTAKAMVDKIIDYTRKAPRGLWKNRVLALGDDEDGGIHYKQTEWFMNNIGKNDRSPYLLEKIYLPVFPRTAGVCQSARDKMYRLLDDGVVWWSFIGHATNHSWTGEGMLTYTDINNMYLKHMPFVYAATCNFLRWDSNTLSGGEILMDEANGGVIGMISATRPVYITYNGYFTYSIGKELSRRDENGRLPAVGEIYRRAKNNIRIIDEYGNEQNVINNENRLRYVFMGDPAFRLSTPDNIISIETVDGIDVDGEQQIIIPARGLPTVKGFVTDPAGNILNDFNGTLYLDLYDADKSTVLTDDEYEGQPPFDEHGDKLYSGSCRVVAGHFELKISMPSDIADNFREATMSLYAHSDDYHTEASGLDHNCYVYGFDENAAEDNEVPKIEYLALNHPNFKNGDTVNSDPMLIAKVSDNVGINLSSAGVGRQMTIMLDDKVSYNDVPLYYTPSSDGSVSGEIAYPLEKLTTGNHTLRFRVFDTNGNSATQTIDFFVSEGLKPTIYDVYCDANPASTEANFYISHDRPESMMTVTVSVYNLLGHKLWEKTTTARSDMFTSAPLTWDLTDATGRRVTRGIYLYKASISADGENYETASRKIAVTAR